LSTTGRSPDSEGACENVPSRLRSIVEEQVRKTIDAIRPAVQADGGDIFLRNVDVETGVVTVELVGACVSCPASSLTLKAGVERILKDRVSGVTAVEALGAESESPVSL
jgi:Fe-S cluster biogenesis protein NfuA